MKINRNNTFVILHRKTTFERDKKNKNKIIKASTAEYNVSKLQNLSLIRERVVSSASLCIRYYTLLVKMRSLECTGTSDDGGRRGEKGGEEGEEENVRFHKH